MTVRVLPTIPSFAPGPLSSASLNTLANAVAFSLNMPAFRMYQTVAQSIPNTTFTQAICDTLDYDSDNGRSGVSPYTYTIPSNLTGRWNFSAIGGFVSNGSGFRIAVFYKNGAVVNTTQVAAQPVSAAAATTDVAEASETFFCNAGDQIGLYLYQTSGGALNTDAGHVVFQGRLESLANP